MHQKFPKTKTLSVIPVSSTHKPNARKNEKLDSETLNNRIKNNDSHFGK